MSDEELMNGYEAACVAKDQGVKVYHVEMQRKAEINNRGILVWSDNNEAVVTILPHARWRVVEGSDEPEPPEGCELWPVVSVPSKQIEENMPPRKIYMVNGPEFGDDNGLWMPHEVSRDTRFRGWGYVVDGELQIIGTSIGWKGPSSGNVYPSAHTGEEVVRPDYAVMAKEEANK